MPSSDENPDYDLIVHESIGNSMLRILLQNQSLQRPLFEILFQDIRKRVKPENERQAQDLVLLIGQMKFVNFRDNSEYIFKEYFEMLAQCNLRAREMLIGVIDDFVELTKHSLAMDKIL